MRPVRFVALSEDGQAFVLADEVGRLLALPIDDRVQVALRPDRLGADGTATHHHPGSHATLSPRDIQARIRSGESAEEVARVAGVPVDRVLRYAGPVLQERAMLAQHARRTKLRTSDKGATLAEVVDARLAQHGVDNEKISWDAYRRDDGTWRIVATWPSGKATAQALWELDKARQVVTPQDDMAQYLCTERPTQILGQDPPIERPLRGESSRGELGRGDSGRGDSGRGDSGRGDSGRGDSGRGSLGRNDSSRGDLGRGAGRDDSSRGDLGRNNLSRDDSGRNDSGRNDSGRGDGGREPMRPAAEAPRRDSARPGRGLGADPIRAGRDALLASLDRPLGSPRRDAQDAPARDRAGTPARESGGLAKPAAAAEPAPSQPPAPAAESTAPRRPARGAAALIGKPAGSAFEDDREPPQEMPAVPSLAVLRPRRTGQSGPEESEQPRKRLPSWDDVLFGGSPAARETS